MADLRICCLTWNLELEVPDAGQLKNFFAAAFKTPPDIVAIGIQEGGGQEAYRKLFQGALPGKYTCITKVKFTGITKAAQIFAINHAAQGLYIFIREAEEKDGEKDVGKAASDKGTKSALSEKGYCYAEVTVDGYRIAFISTHAEVKEDKRGADFKVIEDHLATHAAKDAGPFSAIFMMGDLNYRLERKADAKKEDKLNAERDEVWKMMCTADGREELLKLDTFKEPKSAIPWQWSPFSNECLPTYKRVKAKEAKPLLAKLEKSKGDYDIEVVKALYPLIASKKGENPLLWDSGYLDRIAVACDAKAGSILKPGLALPKPPELKSGNFLVGGDHVPVYAHYKFTYK